MRNQPRVNIYKDWNRGKYVQILNKFDDVRKARITIEAYKTHMAAFGKASSRSTLEYDDDDVLMLKEYLLDTGEIVFSVQWSDIGPDGYGSEPMVTIFKTYNQALSYFKSNVASSTIKKSSLNRKASQVLVDLERRIARLERNL